MADAVNIPVMARTTIQVSDKLADELYRRKGRGESYEDVIWQLIDAADARDAPETIHGSDDTQPKRTAPPPTQADTEEIEAVLDSWRPGRTPEEREERRAAGTAVLRWLRDRGQPAQAAEFKDELYDEHGIEGQSPDTWWRKVGRAELEHAQEEGLVQFVDGYKEWEWVGPDS